MNLVGDSMYGVVRAESNLKKKLITHTGWSHNVNYEENWLNEEGIVSRMCEFISSYGSGSDDTFNIS